MQRSTESSRPQPFFARFLELQDYPSVASDVRAGPGGGGGGGGDTKPTLDFDYTMKFPSDGDEGEV